jgi:hypothetical protein
MAVFKQALYNNSMCWPATDLQPLKNSNCCVDDLFIYASAHLLPAFTAAGRYYVCKKGCVTNEIFLSNSNIGTLPNSWQEAITRFALCKGQSA